MGTQKLGVCKLTGTVGPYVKSHILPAALTRLNTSGKKIIEVGIGQGEKNRFVGWYDNALVTRVGEDILEEIDTPAIELLREHKLVWSGWEGESLTGEEIHAFDEGMGFRVIEPDNPRIIQLFFLSVLWRAAASDRSEFVEIKISEEILEDLRKRVAKKDPGDFSDFPINLYQITTRGIPHNRAPLLESRVINFDEGKSVRVDYVRIYLDGLIAHVQLQLQEKMDEEHRATCLKEIGPSLVSLHKFEHSRTFENITEMTATVMKEKFIPNVPLKPIALASKQCCQN